MTWFILAIVAVSSVLCVSHAAELHKNRPKIVLFGDSITEYSYSRRQVGWGALLAERFVRSSDVLNRGFSGYNSRWARMLMKEALHRGDDAFTNPSLAVIFFGANDASAEGTPLHVPLPEYRTNIESIVDMFRESTMNKENTALILVTPPPVNCPNRDINVTSMYAAAIREISAEKSVPMVDLWPPAEHGMDIKVDLSDGIHLSSTGNRKVELGVLATIKQSYTHLMPKAYYPTARHLSKLPTIQAQEKALGNW